MQKIRCVVERITYQNPENGYSVLKCRVKAYHYECTPPEESLNRIIKHIKKALPKMDEEELRMLL